MIKKYIEFQKYKMLLESKLSDDMRIHMSNKPINLIQKSYIQKPNMKPEGFWYGFGNEWVDWCKYEMPDRIGKYKYNVDVGDTNILKIKTLNELKKFNQDYHSNLFDNDISMHIDWVKVASEYDGIEINPYQYQARFDIFWYYGWDVASGCVWNLKNVKLNLIK